MSIRIAVLGSGSAGNSTLVEFHGERARDGQPLRMLIDAGFSPRETARRLANFRVRLDQISDILITHLDHDHLRLGWRKACERFRIRMHLCRRHYRRSPLRFDLGDRLLPFEDHCEPFDLRGGRVRVEPVRLAHDQLGSTGYVIEHAGERLGFATDLGRVPAHMYETFRDLDFLAIESNYDRQMQVRSQRPEFLKRRIMGGLGHLSNHQTLDAVMKVAAQSRLRHVILLHLSRECNHPDCIELMYAERAAEILPHVTIAHQFDPTPMLTSRDAAVIEVKPIRRPVEYEQPTLWSMAG